MGPVSYMTHASVLGPVPFPQLSLHVRKLSSNHSQSLRFGSAGDRSLISSYCLALPRVLLPRIIVSTYTIVLGLLIVLWLLLLDWPYLGPFSFRLHTRLWVA